MKINLKTVEGCLNSLKNTGLIKEPAIGHFRRVTAGSTAAPKVTPLKIAKTGNSERIMESTVAAKEDKSSLESLIEVSEELVKTANNLSAMARKLEQVADEVADEQGADTEELQKLRQLSSLLKDLHGGE
jgi:chemotaxis protein histidine kinase CheA